LTRFLPSGGVDTSFGSLAGHTVVQPAAPGLDALPHSAAFGPDGSIYVAGSAADPNDDSQMVVARFGAGGQLDRSFGTGGFKLLQTSTAADSADRNSFATSVVVQPNGRIVLVGAATFVPQQTEGVIVRLMPDGSVDTSFGNGGVARVRLGTGDAPSREFEAALGLAGGKLLVSGNQTVGNQVRDAILGRVVLDLPPVATISATPSQPHVGDPVSLSATATDPDGTVASISWDLNGDGVFGDATGPSATTRFDRPGNHDVAAQVTDDDQVASVARATIAVPATPVSGVRPVPPVLRDLTIAPGRFAPDPLRPPAAADLPHRIDDRLERLAAGGDDVDRRARCSGGRHPRTLRRGEAAARPLRSP
jgi:uncharacterized delta-60 repeat protein